MSSYAIAAVSSPQAIIEAHRQRGFDVLTLALSWQGAQALAQQLGAPRDAQHLMVVSTLARRVHEAQRAQRDAFSSPTLVVLPHLDEAGLATADWQHVRQAAEAAGTEVVFLQAQG